MTVTKPRIMMGATTAEQVHENAKAVEIKLSQENLIASAGRRRHFPVAWPNEHGEVFVVLAGAGWKSASPPDRVAKMF